MSEAAANCLAILGRSQEIYDAVLALVHTGRSLPALMLDRPLFEDMVAAFWLSHPDNRESGVQRIREQEDHIVLLSNDAIRKYPHRVLIDPEEHDDSKRSAGVPWGAVAAAVGATKGTTSGAYRSPVLTAAIEVAEGIMAAGL